MSPICADMENCRMADLNGTSSELERNSDRLGTVDIANLNDNVKALIIRIQRQILSVAEIQDASELGTNLNELEPNLNEAITKICDMARQTLVRTVIAQAISLGFVTREHPESPRHPRQRYLLTTKGLQVLGELMRTNGKSKI